ncbi:hypothetical protein CKO31_22725 [Thiohalocapsa halophila]|uniref:Uncharacterized protein n=1 Tax=Thiohalocapsa halophila TaxID=69359 RepID=A0ABS1CP95_9GAMM|nr:hypothetical protein [Thiohalocapsa halophila]MBK1633508.1 hypothetical protein [Thiohalocapsa halophila]
MPKTDWSARSSPGHRRPWLVPPGTDPAASPNTPNATPAPSAKPRSAASKSKKHFVEPYPYTAAQRTAIERALADCELGDATAREIFIGAIAYDLAVLAAGLDEQREPETSAPQAAATDTATAPEQAASQPSGKRADAGAGAEELVAERARALADALAVLDARTRAHLTHRLTDSDPLRRVYADAYLDALGAELAHLGHALSKAETTQDAASAATADAGQPRSRARAEPASPPPASAADTEAMALAFIRHAAQVYEQCFDDRPAAAAKAPFAQVLRAVAKATDTAIPTDTGLLQRALS